MWLKNCKSYISIFKVTKKHDLLCGGSVKVQLEAVDRNYLFLELVKRDLCKCPTTHFLERRKIFIDITVFFNKENIDYTIPFSNYSYLYIHVV